MSSAARMILLPFVVGSAALLLAAPFVLGVAHLSTQALNAALLAAGVVALVALDGLVGGRAAE